MRFDYLPELHATTCQEVDPIVVEFMSLWIPQNELPIAAQGKNWSIEGILMEILDMQGKLMEFGGEIGQKLKRNEEREEQLKIMKEEEEEKKGF